MKRDRGGTRRGIRGCEEGSLLAEALIGVGLLAMFVASTATFVPAAQEARRAARMELTAITLGDSIVEAIAMGVHGEGREWLPDELSEEFVVEVDSEESNGRTGACGAPSSTLSARNTVRISYVRATQRRDVQVSIAGRPSSRGDDTGDQNSLVLTAPLGHDLSASGAVLSYGEDSPPLVPAGTDGCLAFVGLPSGSYRVSDDSPSPLLIDSFHVPLEDRPVAMTLRDSRRQYVVDALPASMLTVHVDVHGARLADQIVDGALHWYVRGDDLQLGTELGASRPVHPGWQTVVVTACRDSESTGSTLRLELEPEETTAAAVELPSITVSNVGSYQDAWLLLQKRSGCADGIDRRPILIFQEQLEEDMRIAIPRGQWDAWLASPSGVPITGSVGVDVSRHSTSLRLP